MIPNELIVEWFPLGLLWNVFLQGMFKKVSYIACCGISSHKACCGRFPTCIVGLAYNCKSCVLRPRYLSLKLVTFGRVICWHKVCLKMKTTLKMKTSSRMKTTLNHGSRIIYHESCISSIMYPVLCSCIMHHEKWKILLDKVVIYFHICMWYVVTCIL